MQETTNYKLKKLELTDFADITELNSNADIVDAEMKKHNNDIETIKNSYVTSVNGKKGAVTIPIATKEQAETGTDNTVYMSPLRTKEAIQKFAPLKTVNNQKPDINGNVNVEEYTHPVTGVNAGTYRKVTVNDEGHVTAGVGGAVPVTEGGTGATNAKQALKNLGGVRSVNGVVAGGDGDVKITIPTPPVTSVNGQTGAVTITIPKGVKDITISGKTITVTFDDGTKKTLTTQDTNSAYMPNYTSRVQIAVGDYTPASNGIIILNHIHTGDGQRIIITHKSSGLEIVRLSQARYPGDGTIWCPVVKNETYTITVSGGNSKVYFCPLKAV